MIRRTTLLLSRLLPVVLAGAGLFPRRRRHGLWAIAGGMFGVHLLLLSAILAPGNRLLGPVTRRFSTRSPELWLTLDDGPDPEDTPHILDLLREHNAKATFFVIGEKARRHPHLVRRILREGHTIGNHTMTHPERCFWRATRKKIAREIDDADTALQEVAGIAPGLFRAPAGHTPPGLRPLLEEREMILCGWSARGFDTACHDPERVLRRILRRCEPGAIVLLHEGVRDAAGNSVSQENVRRFLAAMQERGYHCVIPGPGQLP